ncbi:hepatocyte growth factor-regulated tyrosine kinase substrate isoform X2 [Telopea speciosissima]|uniref:hepatocyte growth factor-regulated tyrosine kinase substrate isoform X2 n=1 Tax=Telopea speciosissima TaxID=54955 RepID=UPI001CC5653F|nr:hepatocyte growth factor-regulated tyrosine kinase substrate isoform X2 [Telopea speciosissima]
MSSEPPPFQEAARCDVCNCSFNAFKRRHHCRCCGRTFCHEHSSNQMALPQFGIQSCVRVCSDCFNTSSRSGGDDSWAPINSVDAVADLIPRLDKATLDVKDDLMMGPDLIVNNQDCRCGMPLCICVAPDPDPVPSPLKMQTASISTTQSSPRVRKLDNVPKNARSVSNSNPSLGQMTNGSLDHPQMDYEVNGEGLREAIKNRDIAAVKKLLSEGVDANYCDKQGLSLLHLAALFNLTEISFALMDHGARVDCKNAQGETPLDCAPVMLQFKMQKKIEGGGGGTGT